MKKNSSSKRLREIKTAAIFLFTIILLFILGLLSFWRMESANKASTEIEKNWLQSTRTLGMINLITVEYRLAEMEHVLSLRADEMSMYESHMDSLLQRLAANKDIYEKLISSENEQALYEDFIDAWNNYLKVSKESLALSRQNFNLEATTNLRGSSHKLYINMGKTLDKLIELNVESARVVSQRSKKSNDEFVSILLFIGLMGGMALILFIHDLWKRLLQM